MFIIFPLAWLIPVVIIWVMVKFPRFALSLAVWIVSITMLGASIPVSPYDSSNSGLLIASIGVWAISLFILGRAIKRFDWSK